MTAHLIEKLSPYLDGELPPSEEALVSAHLRDCPDCSQRLAELAAVDRLAQGLAVEAPPGYFEGFPARVRERLPARPAGVRRLPRWALAAAAVLLVAVITPLSIRERSPSPPVADLPRAAEPRPAPASVLEAKDQAARGLGYVAVPEGEERDARRERRETARPRSKPAVVSEPAPARQVTPPAPAAPPPAPPLPDAEAQRLSAAAATPAAAASAVKGRGPWFQSQSQSPGTQAPAPPEQTAVEERSLEAKSDRAPVAEVAESEVAADKRGSLAGSGRAEGASAPLINKKKKEERAGFEDLAARRPRNAAEARTLREAARRAVTEDPSSDQADEARVLVIEAGVLAFSLSRDPADLARVEADARAYLARADAGQVARVRALLASVSR